MHLPPLCYVEWFHHPWDLIHKGNGTSDVIENSHVSNLLPRHGHVFQQLQHCMWHVFQCPTCTHRLTILNYSSPVPLPQIYSLVIPKLSVCHVAMVTDDLSHVLWGHVFLLCLHKTKLPFLRVSLGLQLLPFASCKIKCHVWTNRIGRRGVYTPLNVSSIGWAPKVPSKQGLLANLPFSCSFSSESGWKGGKGYCCLCSRG